MDHRNHVKGFFSPAEVLCDQERVLEVCVDEESPEKEEVVELDLQSWILEKSVLLEEQSHVDFVHRFKETMEVFGIELILAFRTLDEQSFEKSKELARELESVQLADRDRQTGVMSFGAEFEICIVAKVRKDALISQPSSS